MMFQYDQDYKLIRCAEAETKLACGHDWHYLTQEHARALMTEEALDDARALTYQIHGMYEAAVERGDLDLASKLADVL